MYGSLSVAVPISTKIQGSAVHGGATDCTLSRIARAIWPRKTAEHWAAAAGTQPRMAKYWLAGRVSDSGKLAIIVEITRRS